MRPVVVVIVTYNSGKVINEALAGLAGYSVQIVDNGSVDDTLEIAAKYDNVSVLRSPRNLGYGAAVNVGAALHPESDVFVLNPDVVVPAGAIERLAEWSQMTGTGLVAPRLVNSDGSLQFSARNPQHLLVVLASRTPLGRTRVGKRLRDWHHLPSMAERPQSVPWVTGAAMLVVREAFEVVGGFDVSYFMYHEDQDLCLRLWRAGWRVVYVPEVVFQHGHARASRTNWLAAKRHLVSTLKFYRRHPSVLLGPRFAAVGTAAWTSPRGSGGDEAPSLGSVTVGTAKTMDDADG
ncbi:glycosyltransferase family 2 protein [Blastococcus sp. SYSU DS0753]